ncbi:MAG: ribulose-phosphate 3-epimerase [Spirochaetes bacterium]|nr:ribulose-phosphate 3-epimerase [Spirochaetota bacterium]
MNTVQIAPSLLAADFADVVPALDAVAAAGADWLHLDVMDGNFVPNITFGPKFVADLRTRSSIPFDVHLMITNPDMFAPLFIDAGANMVSVHIEGALHLNRTVTEIRKRKVKAGVVLNPHTPASSLDAVIEDIDHVLIMTVNPGFGGQSFIESSFRKIASVRKLIDDRHPGVTLAIDGGVTEQNAGKIIAAGADFLIAGTSFFGSADKAATVKKLRSGA